MYILFRMNLHVYLDGNPYAMLIFSPSIAPSYFSYYFVKQIEDMRGEDRPIRTLHVDRDPDLFRDIARHLQGLKWAYILLL